jgi:autotransporter-associated beta strand protein
MASSTNFFKNNTDIGSYFVDLTNNQSVGGTKTFTSSIAANGGLTVPLGKTLTVLGTVSVPAGSINVSALTGSYTAANVPSSGVTGLNGSIVDTGSAQTLSGTKTFSDGLTVSSGTVSFPNNSINVSALTGSYTAAYATSISGLNGSIVDTGSTQTLSGAKTFSGGLAVSSGTVSFPNNSINVSALTGSYTATSVSSAGVTGLNGSIVDTGSVQTISGNKTLTGFTTFNGSSNMDYNGNFFVGGKIGVVKGTAPAAQSVLINSGTFTNEYGVAYSDNGVYLRDSVIGKDTRVVLNSRKGIQINDSGETTAMAFTMANNAGNNTVVMNAATGTIQTTGYISIGALSNATNYPLQLIWSNYGSVGSNISYTGGYGTFGYSGATARPNTDTGTLGSYVGIATNTNIACNSVFGLYGPSVTSDIRVKNNVDSIDNTEGLDIIRKLQPRRFQYKDKLKSPGVNIGFIAQEVGEVFPEAITYKKECIPNIFENVAVAADQVTLTLNAATTSVLVPSKEGNHVKLHLYNEDNSSYGVEVIEVVDDKTFVISQPVQEGSGDKAFVYGTEVDDFQMITHDKIFTMAVSAVKEMDTIIQQQQRAIAALEAQIASIAQRLGL